MNNEQLEILLKKNLNKYDIKEINLSTLFSSFIKLLVRMQSENMGQLVRLHEIRDSVCNQLVANNIKWMEYYEELENMLNVRQEKIDKEVEGKLKLSQMTTIEVVRQLFLSFYFLVNYDSKEGLDILVQKIDDNSKKIVEMNEKINKFLKTEAENKPEECQLCYIEKKLIKIIPCGHWICKTCFSKINKCPYCRSQILVFYENQIKPKKIKLTTSVTILPQIFTENLPIWLSYMKNNKK